jgi:hypothetical protein
MIAVADTTHQSRHESTDIRWPELIVHCDWSKDEHKRWMAKAELCNGKYKTYPPVKVDEIGTFVDRVAKERGPNSSALIGFDFPIGVPAAYATQIEISQFPSGKRDFIELLERLGKGDWANFYTVQDDVNKVGIHQPFYPDKYKGEVTQAPFLRKLGVTTLNDLRRRCDLRQPAIQEEHRPARRAACPIFWTLGGNQVGKGAIAGWKEVLAPAVETRVATIWPFHGTLAHTLKPGSTVLAETYPTQYHHRLFGQELRGKRLCSKRKEVAGKWLELAREWKIDLDPALSRAISNGFSTGSECAKVPAGQKEKPDNNDDAFDAAIGLFGMIDAIQNYSPALEPKDTAVQKIEGWIFGQPAN